MDVESLIEQNLGKKTDIKFLPMQRDDVKDSFAGIKKNLKKC